MWKLLGASRVGFSRACDRCLRVLNRRPYLWHTLAGLLFAVLVWQFTYPVDRALPLARLDGVSVGGKSSKDITNLLASRYTNVPVALTIADKKYTTTATAAGVSYDEAAVMRGLRTYSAWQRIIPFSLPILGLMRNQPVPVKLDQAQFATYAQERSQDCALSPTMAGVRLKGSTLQLIPAENGRACAVESMRAAFENARLYQTGIAIKLTPTTVQPAGSGHDMSGALQQAQAIIDHVVTLKLLTTAVAIPKDEVASWLTLPYDDTTSSFRIEVDTTKIQTYLDAAQKSFYVVPGTTYIHSKNGIETSREVGATGQGIDMDATTNDIVAQLFQGSGTVQATITSILPSVTYDEPYSADKAGLQKLINDLVRNKGDYAISVRSLDNSIVADAQGTKQYHPASTYKIFVAWAVLQKIDSGKLHGTDSAINGLDVNECFTTMIIDSDNSCAEYFGETVIGWANLNTMLRNAGLTCTNLNTAWYSCANDETLFLHKLQSGQLLGEEQTTKLLDAMKQQTYRDGIPDGISAVVADKVGFLDGLLHDAAIVYDPHGTYALTILTNGSSWNDIADATWQINAQLARMQ